MKENENAFVAAMRQDSVKNVNKFKGLDSSAEHILSVMGVIILVSGVIATFIGLIYLFSEGFSDSTVLIATISILLGTLITWSVLEVLANISLTLKEINAKIKDMK